MRSTVDTIDAYLAAAPADPTGRAAAPSVAVSHRVSGRRGSDRARHAGVPAGRREEGRVREPEEPRTVARHDAAVVERHRARLAAADAGKACIRYRKVDAIDFGLVETLLIESRDGAAD